MEQVFMGILGGTIGILLALLAWIGNKVHSRLDAINCTLVKIDKDLSTQIGNLHTRVSILEVKQKDCG